MVFLDVYSGIKYNNIHKQLLVLLQIYSFEKKLLRLILQKETSIIIVIIFKNPKGFISF